MKVPNLVWNLNKTAHKCNGNNNFNFRIIVPELFLSSRNIPTMVAFMLAYLRSINSYSSTSWPFSINHVSRRSRSSFQVPFGFNCLSLSLNSATFKSSRAFIISPVQLLSTVSLQSHCFLLFSLTPLLGSHSWHQCNKRRVLIYAEFTVGFIQQIFS